MYRWQPHLVDRALRHVTSPIGTPEGETKLLQQRIHRAAFNCGPGRVSLTTLPHPLMHQARFLRVQPRP